MSTLDIVACGEMLVEFARSSHEDSWQQSFGGDSFNTAVYLSRAGLRAGYMTRLGDDDFSRQAAASLRAEAISLEHVETVSGRQIGLYTIHNSPDGERSFSYWRGQSPAREMFDQPARIPDCLNFYFSGISLAIIASSGLSNCVAFLEELEKRHIGIIFDPNYRPRLWRNQQAARQAYEAVLPMCDIVLPTFTDEQSLWGLADIEACRSFYKKFQIRELVIKAPDLSCHVFSDGDHLVKSTTPVKALDTTGAGDSFNAGYLAARLRGQSVAIAIADAQTLSAKVIQCRGAIMPRQNTI
jgi:2-dehydro-3-deoxygluconokinase